jgi:DNA-binding MarR family transcriptional regulator
LYSAQSEVVQVYRITISGIVSAVKITTENYQALAELRYRIRHFLRDGDAVARAAGLEPQQYLLLLTIRGLPAGEQATIRTLAERLALKHHSAVELVDRLESHGYVHRNRGRDDRRSVLVSLLPRGERILQDVARQRINELRSHGRELARTIEQLLQKGGKPHSRQRTRELSRRKATVRNDSKKSNWRRPKSTHRAT